MSWRARAVPGHGHPAIHNIPCFWACLVSPISTSYPRQLYLKATWDVPKVVNSSSGKGMCVCMCAGEGMCVCSGPPTLRFNRRTMAFLFHATPPQLSLSLCPYGSGKKSILTRGTFLLHLAQLVHFLVMTTKKDRAHTLGTHLPRHGARESLSHGPARRQNCRALFTCKYSELDVAHSLFYSFVFFFLFSVSHVSPLSIKSGSHVLTYHVGHGGQDRSKAKAGKGFGFIRF